MGEPKRVEEVSALIDRRDVLERLGRDPAHVRDLVDETDHSRRTVSRALGALEAQNFVERGDGGITLTTAGRLAHRRFEDFLTELDEVLTAEEVLAPLPASSGVEPEAIVGGEAVLATESAPYRPLERLLADLLDAGRYRAVLPSLDSPRLIRLLYERVVTDDRPAELVVSEDVFETLHEEFPRRAVGMADTDGCSVSVGPTPPFGLWLIDRTVDDEPCRSATTVHLVVLTARGTIHGSIVTDAEPAVRWAEDRFEECRRDATDRTGALVDGPEGDVQRGGDRAGGSDE
ncbi:winged helix-turn-helix domain-containing protein [Halovivax sp.]|uniref:helix-turn-helix transcriptional regulator n=1 Tax=Halovivax sp. TaxID=1935978 RepID=UPI0025C1E754|nr:MarR family transcriptional regulator [Halovivax sp.]